MYTNQSLDIERTQVQHCTNERLICASNDRVNEEATYLHNQKGLNQVPHSGIRIVLSTSPMTVQRTHKHTYNASVIKDVTHQILNTFKGSIMTRIIEYI